MGFRKILIKSFFSGLIFFSMPVVCQLFASDTHFFVIPGQNGMGGQNCVSNGVINPSSDEFVSYVDTPSLAPDFGQDYCMQYLKESIETILSNRSIKNFVLHASSQGTATAINYTLQTPHKIKALILESIMGSGNSAINHTVKTLIFPEIVYLPGSYYWLPYLAKFSFPYYRPAGQQPILSLEDFPKDVLVIIIHATRDPQLSYNDALSLYYGLRHFGNQKVYLFTIDVKAHILLLERNKNWKEITAINQIFKNNQLPYNKEILEGNELDSEELKKYQPPEDQYKTLYESFVKKENIIKKYVSKTAMAAFALGISYFSLSYLF